ncbi:MAG: SGNH/GDSL hydrolase family protein [Thermomicrobiales bacterium]
MARLPQPGGDAGNWGEILNDFLAVEHNGDGTLKPDGSLATKYTKPDTGIPSSDLDNATQTTLDDAQTTKTRADAIEQPGWVTRDRLASDVVAELDSLTPGPGEIVVGGAAGPMAVPNLSPRPGNTIAFMGDSITANPATGKYDTNYRNWTTLLLGDIAGYAGAYATGFLTVAQIRDTHLPQVLASNPVPTFTVVLAGRNNDTSITADIPAAVTGAYADLLDIYNGLRTAGSIPVVCGLPPRAATQDFNVRLNSLLAAYARQAGFPFVNFSDATLMDPSTGGYLAGLSDDDIHPTPAGHEVMARLLAPVIRARVVPWSAPLAQSESDPSNAFARPLFTVGFTDSNADGLPDGVTGGTGGYRCGLRFGAGQANATIGYQTDAANVAGRWLTITKSGTGDITINGGSGAGGTSQYVPANPGDLLEFGCRAAIENGIASVQWEVVLAGRNSAANVIGNDFKGFGTFGRSIGPITHYGRATIPMGFTDGGVRLFINATGNGTGATLKLGQITIRNLTALGITP